MRRWFGKALLLVVALALAPRALAQCVNNGYIVVDGQSCDWTPAENYLSIAGNPAPPGGLSLTNTDLTDDYSTSSTGDGNLYGLMTFKAGTTFAVGDQVGLFLDITGPGEPAPDPDCNANYALSFTCITAPCTTSADWNAIFYGTLSTTPGDAACNNARTAQTLTTTGANQQAQFAINGTTVEFGLNFGAPTLPRGATLPTTFLATPYATTNYQTNSVLTTSPQTSYNATTVGPSAVTLGALVARAEAGRVIVGWLTRGERGNLGFYVYRQRGEKLTKVGEHALPSRFMAFSDEAYRVVDRAGRPGDRYWIADIDQHTGRLRYHGPVTADPHGVLPEPAQPSRSLLPGGRPAAGLGAGPGAHGSPLGGAPTRELPSAARLGVSSEGMVWLPDTALQRALVRAAQPAQVSYQGLPVTSVREGAGTLFYARPVANGYDGVDAYLLAPGAPADPTAQATLPGPNQPLVPTVQSSFHAKQYLSFDWDAAGDDPYIWAWASNLFSPDPVSFDAPAAAAALNGGGTLTANLLGGTQYAHHVSVELNGTILGETSWSGLGAQTFTAALPPGVLLAANNSLVVNAIFDTGASLEFVMLESIDVTYDRLPLAVAGDARFSLPSGSCAGVAGLADGALAWEITDPQAAKPLAGLSVVAGTVNVCSPSDGQAHRYEAFNLSAAQTPSVRALTGARLQAASNAADELVVVPPSLASALQPLVAAREAQGLRVLLANPIEIDDAFAYGDAGRAGLRAFLQYTRSNWAKAPRYVLLAGAANADPRDVLATGLPDLIPSGAVVAGPQGMRSASDSWYATGVDAFTPEVAIGRLPADTTAQLAGFVAKVLQSDAQGPPTGNALLVADVPLYSNDADFAANSTVVGGRLQAAGWSAATVSAGDANPVTEISAALAAGIDLWHYVGHAGVDAWGGGSFLTADQMLELQNARLPMLTSYDCLDGMFDNPTTYSVAASALSAPTGGVYAAFVPSTVLSPREAQYFDLLVTGALLAPPRLPTFRLGDALLEAQRQAAAEPSLADFVRTYNLLGDPASRLPLQ